MKKKVLLIAAIFVAGATFAQDAMTSKKGTPILPEAGDYAIGFSAASLTGYMGNLMNGATTNSLGSFGDLNNQVIYGKYFVDATKAYRGMFQLDFGTTTNTTPVPAASGTGTVEDEVSTSNVGITLGGGIEMRRGKGRLQGVYGPMAMISLGSTSTENTYGNPLTAGNSRVTETSSGSTFGITVGGFAGVEYFFAPKLSLGGEIAWGIGLNTTGAGETTTETADAAGAITTATTETGSSSSFNIGYTPMGTLSINFHF